jgi:hypothetical protein
MNYRLLFAAALLLTGCAQRYATALSARTAASPEQTFECVKLQLDSLGYKRTSIDVDEHRVSGAKIDMTARRSDTQFRRVLHKIDVEVAPEADGQTGVVVTARTFAEYTTQRGPTEVEEKASPEVTSAAHQLLERCRS